jgi:hypothetical protein
MKLINRICIESTDADNLELSLDRKPLSELLPGRGVEAQFEVFEWILLVIEVNPEYIGIYLIDENGEIIDSEILGHWYFDSAFENPVVKGSDTLEFFFGSKKMALTIAPPPSKPGKFDKSRLIHYQDTTSEV